MKLHQKHEAHLSFPFWKCMQYHLHIHTLINTPMYYPGQYTSLLEVLYSLFFRTSKHLLCTSANIPIITHHIHAHWNTYALYGQRYFISKCFLKLNSVNVRRIFYKSETSSLWHINAHGTSKYINHCTRHINVPKLLHMAHKCTQITAHGTPVYPNYCTWYIKLSKLLQMAHQCIQITAHGTQKYPNYSKWHINIHKLLHMVNQCTQIRNSLPSYVEMS
jgi:hypothetical protein